jgi:hypothetical protein
MVLITNAAHALAVIETSGQLAFASGSKLGECEMASLPEWKI